jgi:hypothetical protein
VESVENPRTGFPLFPPPLEIRTSSGFPHSHSYGGGYYLNRRGQGNASPDPQRPQVGQIKPPKWAKRSCQTQFWAKDLSIGYKMINARNETVRQKPTFKYSFARRRCLIPADGFFEWAKDGAKKRPFNIGRLLYLEIPMMVMGDSDFIVMAYSGT